MLQLHQSVSNHLKPVPSKFHYEFGYDDMKRVLCGMALFDTNVLDEVQPLKQQVVLIRLWAHESMRTYHDRLVDHSDSAWMAKTLIQVSDSHFGHLLTLGDYERLETAPVFASFTGTSMDQGEGVWLRYTYMAGPLSDRCRVRQLRYVSSTYDSQCLRSRSIPTDRWWYAGYARTTNG